MARKSAGNKNNTVVCLNQVYKFFGNKNNPINVLNGLNLTVSKGSIYGLLGASGCGKTTLLSCIVGIQQLNSGEVWVLGSNSGSSSLIGPKIGFMPQQTALYELFTIRETLLFFGLIYGMTSKEVNDKIDKLLSLLQLPCSSTFVNTLSGGQMRRVSLSIALIHSPQLLVLDEPTVGLDCQLRNLIWDYLIDLAKMKKTTVILTTHYIEETRRADMIGIMREGILLAQESPGNLMQKFNKENIQDVFLELSVKQNWEKIESSVQNNDKNTIIASKTKAEIFIPLKHNHMKALMLKNIFWMMRNIAVMSFIFVIPAFQVFFFCLAIGRNPTGIKLSVTNHELNRLNVEQQSCPITNDGCNYEMLSCRYLEFLKHRQISLTYYETKEEAFGAVRKGESWGVLVFAKNYSTAFVKRLELNLNMNDTVIDTSSIVVHLDMSNNLIARFIERDLFYALTNFTNNLLTTCNINPGFLRTPMSFKTPIYGEEIPNFTNFTAPGIILTIVFFFAVALSVGVMITERNDEIYLRYLIAGVSEVELLLSHVIWTSFLLLVQTSMVFFISFYVFNLPCIGNMVLVIWLLISTGFSGLSFGFFIASVFEYVRTATHVVIGSFLIIFLLSGSIWPLEGMPFALKKIAHYLPITKSTESLRAIVLRGWTLDYANVYEGFIFTSIWTLILFTLSIFVIKLKKN
ncbi:unnamed protein product [Diamesa serratosioi]